jgi:hypothetical protein
MDTSSLGGFLELWIGCSLLLVLLACFSPMAVITLFNHHLTIPLIANSLVLLERSLVAFATWLNSDYKLLFF